MFPVLALLIGGGAILFGILSRKNHSALIQACTAQTSGTVIRVDEEIRTEAYEDTDEEVEEGREEDRIKTREVTTYYSVFEYSAGGQSIIKRDSTGTGRPKYRAGEQVSIFYNPNKLDEFYVAGDTSGSNMGIVLIVVGAGIILAGFLMFFL